MLRMSQDIKNTVQEIIASRNQSVNVTVREVADELHRRLNYRVHPMTVKRILNEMGLYAEVGKKRSWLWKKPEDK